jgi:hypothetical protein
MSAMANQTQSIRVNTKMTPTLESENIDLRAMDEGDLQSLQTQDAFMYHSIPGIHKASLSLREVNHTEVLDVASREANTIVSRKTRVSTEGDMGLAIEDLLLLFDDDDDVPIPPAQIAAPPEQIVASSEVDDDQEAKVPELIEVVPLKQTAAAYEA